MILKPLGNETFWIVETEPAFDKTMVRINDESVGVYFKVESEREKRNERKNQKHLPSLP